jgi:phage recombination protein Bet
MNGEEQVLETKEEIKKTLPPEAGPAQLPAERPIDAKLTAEEIEATYGLSEAAYAVLQKTVCKGAPREIAAFFMLFCKNRNLDPFTRQVYLWPEKTDDQGNPRPGTRWNIVAGIDGMRAIASRSPLFRGQARPAWTYVLDDEEPDGIARFEKTESKYEKIGGKRVPDDCTVISRRAIPQDAANPNLYLEFYGIARFEEFVKVDAKGKIYGNWETQPEHQLRIRAEAMALRMAFPEEVGGIYTEDELRDGRLEAEPTQPGNALAATNGESAAPQPADAEAEANELIGKLRLNSAQREVYRKRYTNFEDWLKYLRAEVAKKEAGPRKALEMAQRPPETPAQENAREQQEVREATEPAATPAGASAPRVEKPNNPLFGALAKLGIKSKPDRLDFAKAHGVVIESFNDLTDEQRAHLLEIANQKVTDAQLERINDTDQECPACLAQPGHPHELKCEAMNPGQEAAE